MESLFETSRLSVRAWRREDAEWFHTLTQDAGLNANTISNDPWRYRQVTVESAGAQIAEWMRFHAETKLGVWPVFDRSSREPLGLCGIKPIHPDGDAVPSWEMMYRFVTRAWGQGLASELAPAIVRYGFEVAGIDRITGGVLPENLASIRVLEKAGLARTREITLNGVSAILFEVKKP